MGVLEDWAGVVRGTAMNSGVQNSAMPARHLLMMECIARSWSEE